MKSFAPDMEAVQLLEKVAPLPVPPHLLDEDIFDSMGDTPVLDRISARPLPSWTFSRKQRGGENLPQTIAHRGYSVDHPENTMGAFRRAVGIGADAIETDVHLTSDGVVVLSHDPTLKRCFGRDEKIIDRRWDDIKDLKTVKSPHEHMPRLADLLRFLATDGHDSVWLLLDIKLDNDASDIIRLIAETISTVKPHPKVPWNRRIVLGCWAAKYIPLCTEYLHDFPITHIGFSTTYARQFFRVPHVSFNLLQQALLVPVLGPRFLKDARRNHRPVYTWTVNDDDKMRWCIREGLDGVLTDDPKRFKEICKDWEHGHRTVTFSARQQLSTVWFQLMVMIFGWVFWAKHGGLDRPHIDGAPSSRSETTLREKQQKRARPVLQ